MPATTDKSARKSPRKPDAKRKTEADTANQGSTVALAKLLGILDLERTGTDRYRGQSPEDSWQRVYGGQVLAQALMAATRTVDSSRRVHSLHAYFLVGGNPKVPIDYEVERLRDGGSFTTRRVKASQNGNAIFALGASFHGAEPGLDHAGPMPAVPPPEQVPSARHLFEKFADSLPENMRTYWQRELPIDMRPVDASRYLERRKQEPRQAIWIKPNGKLPDDPAVHECMLAYASDFTLLDTALIAHGKLLFDSDLQLASLDHAMWFHRPFKADEWLLYVQDSPSAAGSRGFCRGSVYTRDGLLVASVAQEGLVRQRATSFELK